MDNYKTVEKTTESEIIIERSRFITLVAPCADEQAARAVLSERKKQHYSATHNCYAYITDNGKYSKFSDDGEPGGTAGQPILSAIQNAGLINVIVIVTRYFGGIKLGAGGLTRAYLRCASEGIKAAEIIVYEKAQKIKFVLPYEDYQTFLRMKGEYFKVGRTDFSDRVEVTLFVKSAAIGRFSDDFIEAFNGKHGFETISEEYCRF